MDCLQGNTLRVLVTGAGDSVGRVTAEKFLATGAEVHICDVREDALHDTLRANPGLKGTVCDVSNVDHIERLFSDVADAMGHADVLVNCVGIAGPIGRLEDLPDGEWHSCMRVNVDSMFYTMKRVIPGMKKRRFGSIINFSSASTLSRLPNRTAYVVSKYAVEGLTKNAARELGPYNVRCNAILPGAINNVRMNTIIAAGASVNGVAPEEYEEEMLRYISMRTKIEPQELADAVYFLATGAAAHITGLLMEVSGGHEWEQ